MENNTITSLLETLDKLEKKAVTINQRGFVESKNIIQSLKHSMNLDMLKIEDEKSECYVTINLNQVNNIESSNEEICIYLDNDISIVIKFD